jgi:hypothetical protein
LEESKDYETDIYRRIKARDASKPKKVEDQPEEQRRKTDGPAEPARATKSAPVEPPTTPAAVTHGGVRFASAEEIRRRRQEIERKRVEREMREMKEPIISGVRIASSEEIERKREQIERTRTQQAIKEAIASRGIEGVEAVFIKGTVFLAGEVQTKSQKTAAEQAARQFPQVRDVRNSISVKWIQSQMTR